MLRLRLFTILSLILSFAVAAQALASGGPASRPQVASVYAGRPLAFEPNRGQAAGLPAEALYLSRGAGYLIALDSHGGALLSLGGTKPGLLRMRLLGSRATPEVHGLEPMAGQMNYLIGNDPSRWRTGIPLFAKVEYRGVYPGVDLVYYGAQKQLESDFVFAPGQDPSVVSLAFDKARLHVDGSGDLVVTTKAGRVQLHKPVAYQRISGEKRSVESNWRISKSGRAGAVAAFAVGEFDRSRPLIIDPTVIAARYVGGSGTEFMGGMATDSAGNIYVSGTTDSADFPTTGGAFRTARGGGRDAFVTKLSPDLQTLIYSTYLGGSADDFGAGIALGSDGSIYITGQTSSTDFPTVNAFQTAYGGAGDGFLARLNPAGSGLMFSTYFGGSGSDSGSGIALGSDGSAFIVGFTSSVNFPTRSAFQTALKGPADAFVAKFSTSGGLTYSSYLGGTGFENGGGIAVDGQGNAYVTGQTASTDFPVTSNAFQKTAGGNGDAYVAEVNASGSALVFATYLGGSASDFGNSIAVDSQGRIFVTGPTQSTNFPTLKPIQATNVGTPSDGFLTILNPGGATLVSSTYFGGGSGSHEPNGMFVFGSGNNEKVIITELSIGNGQTGLNAGVTLHSFRVQFTSGPGAGLTIAPSDVLLGWDEDFVYVLVQDGATSFVAEVPWFAVFSSNTESGASAAAPVVGGTVVGFSTTSGFPGAIGTLKGRDVVVATMSGVTATGPPGPTLPANSIVNAASFRPATQANSAPAPGSIVAAFGSNFTSGVQVAPSIPLPTKLLDTSVVINSTAAPLFFVSTGQINLQVPFEIPVGNATVQVARSDASSATQTLPIAQFSPGIFTTNTSGTGQGAILIAGSATVAGPVGSVPNQDARPVKAGQEALAIFMTGLGAVTNQPASGAASPSQEPLARTTTQPIVTLGGVQANILFSGLAPFFVGLYQVNTDVPSTVPTGGAVQVVVTIGGISSNPATIAVQ